MLDINSIRKRVDDLRTITLIMHHDAWHVVFDDTPKLCDEVERMRTALLAIIDGVKHADYRESEIIMLAERGLYGDREE